MADILWTCTSSISSRPTIYPWKTGSFFYASISRWVITYCFDINVKICNVLICLELIKMLPKSIHQIAPFSFQNSKIFQLLRGGSFWGGHIPPQTPHCARKRAIGADAPPDHPPNFKTDLRPWVWCGACELTFASEKGGLWAENFQIWGLVSWKFPNLGACELKISKFGGLWAKIWVKIEAVEAKIFQIFSKGGLVNWLFCLKWDPCERQERREKGVFRAAHPHTPFLGQCPPPPGARSTKWGMRWPVLPHLRVFFFFFLRINHRIVWTLEIHKGAIIFFRIGDHEKAGGS